MNPTIPPQTDTSTALPDGDTTFSIPFRHLWKTDFSGDLCHATFKTSGLSRFVGDQVNQVLKCLNAPNSDTSTYSIPWPLVLFGPSGTGKTSLAMAVLSHLSQDSHQKPIFLASVDFARRYRSALENNALVEFQQSFQNASGIIIDDIHHIGHKVGVQKQLAKLVDMCIEHQIPLLITMDQFPVNSTSMAPRLSSRLVSGLCLPVLPPGRSARMVIVNELANQYQIRLNEDAIELIVDSFPISVPNLHHFFAELKLSIQTDPKLQHRPTPLDATTLRKLIRPTPEQIQLMANRISTSVAKTFHLKVKDLKSKSRSQSIVLARNIAIFLQRNLLQLSFNRIGSHFGNRDHATIMHGFQKISKVVQENDEQNAQLRQSINRLTKELTEQLLNRQFASPSKITPHSTSGKTC